MNRVALELEGVNMEDVIGFNKHHRFQTDYDWVNLYVLQVRGIDWRSGNSFVERCFKKAKTLRKYKGLFYNTSGGSHIAKDNYVEIIGMKNESKLTVNTNKENSNAVTINGEKWTEKSWLR